MNQEQLLLQYQEMLRSNCDKPNCQCKNNLGKNQNYHCVIAEEHNNNDENPSMFMFIGDQGYLIFGCRAVDHGNSSGDQPYWIIKKKVESMYKEYKSLPPTAKPAVNVPQA